MKISRLRNIIGMTALTFFCTRCCAQAKEMSKLRLPQEVVPLHYWLRLVPTFVAEDFLTTGAVKIHLNCTKSTNQIVFNVNEIDIVENGVSLEKNGGTKLKIKNQVKDGDRQMYRLELDVPLEPGNVYILSMNFTYRLNTHLEGFYRSSYRDKEGNTRWLASTQFSPIDARRAFPCWDEPSFKAYFNISLGRHKNMSSLSNMPRYATANMVGKEDWVWDHYETTPRMSTYLVAFIVSDLSHRDLPNTTNPHFKVWSRSDLLPQMDLVGDLSPKVLAFIAEYFGIPFPLKKIDIFAVPDFGFSAMENWGLITFAESAIKRGLVISHELAHQWFGNLVTPEWWEDLWLKEGFATFIGLTAITHVKGDSKDLDQWIISELHSALFEDSLVSSHQVSNPVDDPRMIWQAFDGISYDKGASVIRMMCGFLGEAHFKEGLGVYLKRYAFGNARRQQLWEAMSEVTSLDVGRVMDTWTLQAGYPLVTCRIDYTARTLTLSQRRFLLSGQQDNSSSWIIPISYTTNAEDSSENRDHIEWLKSSNITLHIDNLTDKNWILVNVNQSGFFRVNYDIENWNLLLNDFTSLPRMSQAQLVNDAFNLAMGGLVPYHIPLTMAERLSHVKDDLVWNATTTELSLIKKLLNGTDIYQQFQNYVLSLIPSDSLNLNSSHDLYFVKFALTMSHPKLISEAKEAVTKIIKRENVTLDEDIRSHVYCASLKYGDDNLWESLWGLFEEENIPKERNNLLEGLACSQNPTTIQRLLHALLTDGSGIRKQDAKLLFSSLAKNEAATNLALDFLANNWKKFIERYGLGFKIMASMVSSFGSTLNREQQLEKLQKLYNDNKDDLGSTSNVFNSTIERVQINVNWLNKYFEDIKKWIENKKNV